VSSYATYEILKKLPKENNHPKGKNSTNLVTLAGSFVCFYHFSINASGQIFGQPQQPPFLLTHHLYLNEWGSINWLSRRCYKSHLHGTKGYSAITHSIDSQDNFSMEHIIKTLFCQLHG
jgi:hypothetical protein